MATRIYILFNARSGSASALELTGDMLCQHFAERGYEVSTDSDEGEPLDERARRAAESDADVVVAAGGDGTATVVAEALVGSGKPLAVLPLGTANLLARDLGVPLDVDEWLAALPSFTTRQIDVGEVNGRLFLHKVVVGTIPALAAARERIRGRGGLLAFVAFFRYLVGRLARDSRFLLEVVPQQGAPRVELVQAFAVVNNDYDEGLGHVFSRQRLDAGKLSVYLIRRLRPLDALRLALEMLLGNWRHDAVVSTYAARSVTIRTRRPQVSAMIDGEVGPLKSPLTFRIRPLALSVLAPPPVEDAVLEATAEAVEGSVAPSGLPGA